MYCRINSSTLEQYYSMAAAAAMSECLDFGHILITPILPHTKEQLYYNAALQIFFSHQLVEGYKTPWEG